TPRAATASRTQSFGVPGGVFKSARGAKRAASGPGPQRPPLEVRVTCDSATQYVGMARYDLYFRLDAGGRSDLLPFAWNFLKGTFGLWLLLALIIGVSVSLSTYLNGVITLLVTLQLFLGGLGRDLIQSMG